MHSRELAELAALVAIHSPALLAGQEQIPEQCIQQYWTASKCRLERWSRLLRKLHAATTEPQLPATLAWPRVRPVAEEILTSELLTRVWTAMAVAYDAALGCDELTPVARNIFTGHLDARNKLLTLMADGRVIALPEGVKLNHLRRRCERWTDMLLAHLSRYIDIREFACDIERARDFAEDLDYDSHAESVHAEHRLTCQLVLASLRASFAEGLDDGSPNADVNRRIGSAVLAAFRDEIADSTGLVKSAWLERISRTASDAEGMIEELVRLDRGL
jgi:hypothetical protein